MESINIETKHYSFDTDQLSPTTLTSPYGPLSRSVSAASTGSIFSTSATSCTGRDSFGSSTSSIDSSTSQISSSCSSNNRQSFGFSEKQIKRGYVRPQGTDFADSAKCRQSVLNLGSIAHLQYYFARTGLLDGRGGRRAKKDGFQKYYKFTSPETSCHNLVTDSNDESMYEFSESCQNAVSERESMNSLTTEQETEYYSSDDEENHLHMLPPTVSTYNNQEKQIPRPPTLEELKEELEKTLSNAVKILAELKHDQASLPLSSAHPNESETNLQQSLGEIQGVQILDIMTLAIRAAKMYYTAHDCPARLASITSERHIRADLLSVMDVLRVMAMRKFSPGVTGEEIKAMDQWVASIYDILHREELLLEEERKECASWTWLDDRWNGSPAEREWAFLKSMDPDSKTLPPFKSVTEVDDDQLPTEFLKDLMTGLRLVKIHNNIVRRSKRTFGAIEKWHTDFRKPYRCTENLKFWIKAAELRFEVFLKIDIAGLVHGADRCIWKEFEDAILQWCGSVRRELTLELQL